MTRCCGASPSELPPGFRPARRWRSRQLLAFAAILCPLLLTAYRGWSATNPFLPLTASEIRQAVRIVNSSGRAPAGSQFSLIALKEPPKEAVLKQSPTPRRAFVVIYNYPNNQTFEAIANLTSGALDSWKLVPGAEAPVTGEDSGAAFEIARRDPRYARAMEERGIRDLNNVYGVAWSAGYFALPNTDTDRIVREVFYYGGAGQNFYAHPIEGVFAHVDITANKVLDFIDIDRNAPVSRQNFDFSPDVTGQRPALAPLRITQPDGPEFKVENNDVQWQKWHFRFGFQPREGLVIYTVGYEDGGKVRSILYRGALSEMVVPYGDPSAGWYYRNSFDAGELGLGVTANSLHPGLDCPENCHVYDAVVSDESGNPHTIPGAIAIYERYGGIAWKHGDNVRSARDLVITYITQAGNYEYGFSWIFHQDGTLEAKVELTGVMSVKGVADGAHDPYGHLVAKNLEAVHHQHFFSYRLDMDVDGLPNRVLEMNSVPMAAGPKNPFGNAFTMEEMPLRTEREAERDLNLETSRRWLVVNPSATNALGQPTGYALLPGENARPLQAPNAWVRKRAGFLNAHVWVTPYAEDEIYAGGDYPNQSHGGDGLSKWASANRPIDNKDVVLWYNFGITHNPRPEDWPVMPTYEVGFKLVPWGFFAQNPVLDLPVK
jgi:primary-amine oxidase